ncbi:unnamed protein product [Lactuca saligna]|uniref:EGF-like calcium-binding domain-containing protein n=1 Tax=Lactuca saligna TaxID=75948 RepID=A0AA35Z4D6_LACSI|nr:unnamed protein product [Lactuca saligna]
MNVWSFNPCGFAFLAEENHFRFGGARDLYSDSKLSLDSHVHILVDWVIGGGKRNCSQATECKANRFCMDDEDLGGYRRSCNKGYQGNPYLHNGCQDINKCEDNSIYPCYGRCINSPGNYSCTCLQEYEDEVNKKYGCRPVANQSKFPVVVFSVDLVGIILSLAGITGIFFSIKKRKLMKQREKFFEKNDGVLLKQKLNSQKVAYTVTVYITKQLPKAINTYSNEQTVGRGGFEVVYKGVLSDKRVVAIKKSVSVGHTWVLGSLSLRTVELELEALRRHSTTHPAVLPEQVAHEEINGTMILEIQPAD